MSVASGVTLTVNPGVEIYFSPGVSLSASGNIHAEGSPQSRIVFASAASEPDQCGIGIQWDDGDNAVFKHCDFMRLLDGVYWYGSIEIENCTFSHNSSGARVYGPNAGVIGSEFRENTLRGLLAQSTSVQNNTFVQNYRGMELRGGSVSICAFLANDFGLRLLSSGITSNVHNNEFHENSVAVDCEDFGEVDFTYNVISQNDNGVRFCDQLFDLFENNDLCNNHLFSAVLQTTTSVVAANNYWGTQDTEEIAAEIFDGFDSPSLGVLVFQPYLTDSVSPYANCGTGCMSDLDCDSVPDSTDNCPSIPNADQLDFDLDGIGDACDSDIDNDGILNGPDECDYTPLSLPPGSVDAQGRPVGDLDGDCDADLADFAIFSAGFTGRLP